MKLKFPLLLALLATVGLVAADAPKPEEKPAHRKGEGKHPEGPRKPEGVSDEDWKKFQDARKAAQDVKEVQEAKAAFDAAREKAKAAAPDAKEAAVKAAMEAGKAFHDAEKAAIIKADASLEPLFDKLAPHGKGRGEGEGKPKKKKKAE